MNKGVLIWGYLASFILLLGAIFLNNGLIAGKVLYLLGFLAFNLGYLLPLFFNIFQENQENKIGVFLILGVLGFFVFLTGISFFVVSWGGGIILIYIGGGILISAIITLIMVSRRFYETSIYSWFPVLVFGVFMVVSLITTTVNRQVMRVFNLNNHTQTAAFDILENRCNDIFNHIILTDTLHQDILSIKQNAIDIHNMSMELNTYIKTLKFDLIANVEGTKYKVFEGNALDNLFHIQSNVEINAVSRYFLNSNNKACVLKNKIIAYRNCVYNVIPDSENWLKSYIDNSLNTKAYELSGLWHDRTWELQNFYDLPLVTVINQLTNMQTKIVMVEKESLAYLQLKAMCNAHLVVDTTFLIK